MASVSDRLGDVNEVAWEVLDELLDRPISFLPIFARIGGSVNAGLFLSQARYWSKRTTDPEGWFYKTRSDWEAETALTRYEQETARKQLVSRGLLEEKKTGLPAKMHYRVNRAAVWQAILDVGGKIPDKAAKLTSGGKPDRRVSNKPPATVAEKSPTLIGTETTTESTQRLQHGAPSAPVVGRTAAAASRPETNLMGLLAQLRLTTSECRRYSKKEDARRAEAWANYILAQDWINEPANFFRSVIKESDNWPVVKDSTVSPNGTAPRDPARPLTNYELEQAFNDLPLEVQRAIEAQARDTATATRRDYFEIRNEMVREKFRGG